jgi:MFS family permease
VNHEERFPSRAFLRYWSAVAVSGFGDYITLLALQTLVVLTLHGSATQVGLLNSARWLPYLVLGVVVGALVDRRRRRPLLVGTDLLQAVVLGSIPVLWLLDVLSFPVLLGIVVVYGTASVISSAAAMSFLPRLVPAEYLQRAHARTDGTDAAAMTAGPALGGVLVGAFGAPFAVLVDACTYLYSAVMLARVDVLEPQPVIGATARELLHEVREGVTWVYRGSGLTALAVSTHGWFVGNAIVAVVIAPFALDELGLSPFAFGAIGAVGGVGALVGAAITTRVGLRLGTGRTIIACHLVSTMAVAVMALASTGIPAWAAVATLSAGQGLYGLAMGMSNSHEMSYRQLVTPDRLQARTNTTMRSINRAVMVVCAPVAGIVADTVGFRVTLVAAAVVFALVSAGLAATPFRTAQAPA